MWRNMKLLLLLPVLVICVQGAPQDPDDYFGQEEADYDYYYDDDINLDTMDDDSGLNVLSFKVGLNVRNRQKEKAEADRKNSDTLTPERLIQEIDARGSNITIHDSMVDKIDARGSSVNVHTRDTIIVDKSGLESTIELPVETTDFPVIEPLPVAEALESEPLPVAEALESTTTPVPVTEELASEPEATENSEDIADVDLGFMEKLKGLQVGMESVVTILKEISGKVGCENGGGKVERSTSCPPPFKRVGPHDCLFMSLANKVTWASARQICTSLGANLVHPRVEGQGMDFILGITEHTSAPRDTVWVGASDRNQEGVWTWVTGDAAPSDLPWAPGHPKSFNGREDCMAMAISHPLGLQASNCMRKKPFICQKEYVKK